MQQTLDSEIAGTWLTYQKTPRVKVHAMCLGSSGCNDAWPSHVTLQVPSGCQGGEEEETERVCRLWMLVLACLARPSNSPCMACLTVCGTQLSLGSWPSLSHGACLPDDNKFCLGGLQEQRPADTLPVTASNLVPDLGCSSLTQPNGRRCTVRHRNCRPCRAAPCAGPHGRFTRAD